MNVTERFLKYVSFETTSDEESMTRPSSYKELELGKYIARELKGIGLEGTGLDENGYVYGFLPATEGSSAPAIGLVAHMDTAPDASGANVKPRILLYEGGDILLENALVMEEKDYPNLKDYAGQELIVTDGTTLLGADDKAGAAEIITAVEYLKNHPEIPHGKISVCITPDEEIG